MSLLVRLFASFWVVLAGKLLLSPTSPPLVGIVLAYSEIKLSAKMQARVGPYFAAGAGAGRRS